MSSSAATLATSSQPFPRRWDMLSNYAPPDSSNPSAFGGYSSRTSQQGSNSYVDKWLADTTSQSRARSVPLAVQQVDKHHAALSTSQHRAGNTYQPPREFTAYKSPSSRALYDRSHRSLSPDSEIKMGAYGRGITTEGMEEPQIASYLQIPPSINSSKGSLAEFAARITCLFWFEDAVTLAKVEDAFSPRAVVPLPTEANPTIGFRKWVTTLLSTTQVSQNVILLALLFIYRLKKITSNVKGKGGSEYRLLTVALMLGNKFLDDNTYTNKTWADVSGISVAEIHVMEVEFLSNMKYNLYTSAEDWNQWHVLLGRFAEYFERSLRAYIAIPTPISMAPSHLSGQPALPFTPPSEQLSPPHLAAQRMHAPQRQLPSPLPAYGMATNIPQAPARLTEDLRSSDLRAVRSRPVSRKRSFEGPFFALPNKQPRINGPSPGESSNLPFLPAISPQQHTLARLPVPGTSLPSPSASAPLYAPSFPTTVAPSHSQLTLPAPASMPQDQLWQSLPSLPPSRSASGGPTLPSLLTQHPPSLQTVPRSDSQNISPTDTSHASQPAARSPSGYLMYRNSPYRPVRQVNTLLAPPPSMSTLHSPLQHMSQQPTYYQPLSKGPIEPKQGMVPYLTPRQFQMAPMDPSRQMSSLDYRNYIDQR